MHQKRFKQQWFKQQWLTINPPEAIQAAEVQAAVVDDSSGSSSSFGIGAEPRTQLFDSQGLVEAAVFGVNYNTKKRKADGSVC